MKATRGFLDKKMRLPRGILGFPMHMQLTITVESRKSQSDQYEIYLVLLSSIPY